MRAEGHQSQMEREAKLAAGAEFELPDLTGVAPGLIPVSRPSRVLHATYYDTHDLRLARAAITVRFRTGDGGQRSGEWTVKLPRGERTTGHLTRWEIRSPGVGDHVPDVVADLVRARARSAPLEPVATLVTRRRTVELRDAEGHRRVEIDDDDVLV